MIVFSDEQGRYLAHLDQQFPADPAVLEQIRKDQPEGIVYDIPSWGPEFWYFPGGVPTIRPAPEFQEETFMEDMNRVVRITGIPAGTLVRAEGPEGIIDVIADDDPTEFEFRGIGSYVIRYEAFPYREATLYVDAIQQEVVTDGTGTDRQDA